MHFAGLAVRVPLLLTMALSSSGGTRDIGLATATLRADANVAIEVWGSPEKMDTDNLLPRQGSASARSR
jgi:hypothetical protein